MSPVEKSRQLTCSFSFAQPKERGEWVCVVVLKAIQLFFLQLPFKWQNRSRKPNWYSLIMFIRLRIRDMFAVFDLEMLNWGRETHRAWGLIIVRHLICNSSQFHFNTFPFEETSKKTVQLKVKFLSYTLSALERIYADEHNHQLMAFRMECEDWMHLCFYFSVDTFKSPSWRNGE